MANKVVLNFAFLFEGDGTDTSIDIELLTGAVFYGGPNSTPLLASTFATLPTGTSGVACPGLTVASVTLNSVTKKLTVTFTTAPANGTVYVVSGLLKY